MSSHALRRLLSLQVRFARLQGRLYANASYRPAAPSIANRTIIISEFKSATMQLKQLGEGKLDGGEWQEQLQASLYKQNDKVLAALRPLEETDEV
jgi:hypothetical protein